MIDKIIKGKAIFIKPLKVITTPFFSESPATMTLAEAPISVPLPPRQAPKDKAHQKGLKFSIPPICPIFCISGIIVATKGMLSIKAEAIADNHKINIVVETTAPLVASIDFLATHSITPTWSNAPTIINKPAKKKRVGHSTASRISSGSSFVINIKNVAPPKAIVAGSK